GGGSHGQARVDPGGVASADVPDERRQPGALAEDPRPGRGREGLRPTSGTPDRGRGTGMPPTGARGPIELVVAGAAGRMGGRLIALARDAPDLRLVGAFVRAGHAAIGRDAGEVAGVGSAGGAGGGGPAPLPPPAPGPAGV